ncbi:MAG: ComEC/Rec2 family competence protein [Pseudomonadota bacterium]
MRLVDPFLEQHHRWILWCPVLVAFGIGWYFSLSFEPSVYIGILFTVLSFICLVLAYGAEVWRIIFTGVFCVAIGFTAAGFRTINAGTPMIADEIGPAKVIGTVRLVEKEQSGGKILLQDTEIEDISLADTPRHVRIKLAEKFGMPEPGAKISILAVLLPPSPPVAPYSYDFQRHMFFQGIGATGYAIADFKTLQPARNRASAENLRESLKKRILATEGSTEAKAILTALLTGERRLIPEDTWEDIRSSGIAHLLAISGLHIGLVAGFVFFFSRAILALSSWATLYLPIKKISALMAFASILGYCWLVGAPIPAQRAVFMTGIVLFAILIDRVAISLRLAGFAAIFVLLIAPESLFTPSFQMSFAAVVCLIAFYEVFRSRYAAVLYAYGWQRKIAVYLLATFVTTIVASIATAPFALYHFQRVALLPGVLANMIAVPLTAFVIMPASLIAVFMMPFNLESGFLGIALWGIDIVLDTAHSTANMPGAVMLAPLWPQIALIFIVLGGLWASIWQGSLRWGGVPLIVLGLFLAGQGQLPDILISHEGKQIALHDGQGQLAFSDSRAERFTRSIWQSEYGGKERLYWPDRGRLEGYPLRCDDWGCIYRVDKSPVFAFIKDPMAGYQDCSRAELVIAPQIYELPGNCQKARTITRPDLKQSGAHAIYFESEGYRIVTTNELRGKRPWAIQMK